MKGKRFPEEQIIGILPIYCKEAGAPEPGLKQTTSDGSGIIGNFPPGDFTLMLSGAECEPVFGFGDERKVEVHVEPDAVFRAVMRCDTNRQADAWLRRAA